MIDKRKRRTAQRTAFLNYLRRTKRIQARWTGWRLHLISRTTERHEDYRNPKNFESPNFCPVE